jgi:hypothetical protein
MAYTVLYHCQEPDILRNVPGNAIMGLIYRVTHLVLIGTSEFHGRARLIEKCSAIDSGINHTSTQIDLLIKHLMDITSGFGERLLRDRTVNTVETLHLHRD